jgi:hypothetical protein
VNRVYENETPGSRPKLTLQIQKYRHQKANQLDVTVELFGLLFERYRV